MILTELEVELKDALESLGINLGKRLYADDIYRLAVGQSEITGVNRNVFSGHLVSGFDSSQTGRKSNYHFMRMSDDDRPFYLTHAVGSDKPVMDVGEEETNGLVESGKFDERIIIYRQTKYGTVEVLSLDVLRNISKARNTIEQQAINNHGSCIIVPGTDVFEREIMRLSLNPMNEQDYIALIASSLKLGYSKAFDMFRY